MLVPNKDIDEAQLKLLVDDQFGASDNIALEFAPLGEDSWSYRYGSFWVSVRRDLQGHMPQAYHAAHELRLNGNDFILAPLTGRDGRTVHSLNGFPVVVFPFIDVVPVIDGESPTQIEKDRIVEKIDVLHRASVSTQLLSETYEFPFSGELAAGVAKAAKADADCGPMSLPLNQLITKQQHYIRSLESEASELGRFCSKSNNRFVLTHGEPGAGNFFRADGSLLLGDWGYLMWGPPERDWYHLNHSLKIPLNGRPEFMRFYELRWILGEIAEYTAHFIDTHTGNEDDVAMWRRLKRYLPTVTPV